MAFDIAQNDAYHVGTDHPMDFTVTSDGTTAVNINGATPIPWALRKHPYNPSDILTKTGIVTGDGSTGIFRVSLAAADSPGVGVYYMQAAITLSSQKSVVAQGSFEVKATIV